MPANVEAVKAKIQSILTQRGTVQIDRDGDFSIGLGSARAFVRVREYGNGQATVVLVFAQVLLNVPLTPDLYKYVALHSDDLVFGHLVLAEMDDNTGMLLISHTLLGDYLDEDELLYAVYGVAGAADEFDDKLQQQFGGKRFTD
jgi:hypothetical protein